jgi:hypothetical protein
MIEQIENRFEKFLIDLETIVNIDSGSRYVPGLEAVSAFFQKRFQKIGWTTTNYSFDDGRLPTSLLLETIQPSICFLSDIWIRFSNRERRPPGPFRGTKIAHTVPVFAI